MNVGDLVKVKKSTTWRNESLPSTGIIVEVIVPKTHGPKSTRQSSGIRYRIHTGELFFARDLEFLYSSASWSS